MSRKQSTLSPDWCDDTTLPWDIVEAAAPLTPRELERLTRPGFKFAVHDTPI
jgi:hypothetical protein